MDFFGIAFIILILFLLLELGRAWFLYMNTIDLAVGEIINKALTRMAISLLLLLLFANIHAVSAIT